MEARYKQGLPCEAIESRPEPVYEDTLYIWEAFEILHHGRNYSNMTGEPLPIAFSEVQSYLQVFSLYHDVESFIRLLYAVDTAYLSAIRDRTKDAEQSKKAEGNTDRKRR